MERKERIKEILFEMFKAEVNSCNELHENFLEEYGFIEDNFEEETEKETKEKLNKFLLFLDELAAS